MRQTYLILVLTGILLFLGGLGFERDLIQISGLIFGLISVLFVYLKNKKISFPYGFSYYLVFLLLALLTQIWSLGSQKGIEYLFLFTSGGLFWLFFYNLKLDKKFSEIFGWSLIILGILFALIYLISVLLNEQLSWSFSLSAPYTQNHHHLGDFWVLPILFLLNKIMGEKKILYWVLISLGISILAFSLSRSAYVSLLLGAAVMLKNHASQTIRKRFLPIGIFFIVIFLLASFFKTTLYSRIYFLQGVVGVFKHPLGVGLGNFSIVSKELSRAFGSEPDFSTLAHNIFLEVLVGMGILGFAFLAWFFKVGKNILRSPSSKTFYKAVFFALSANFFFDTTYVIPSMLWLWFISLGLAQRRS
ncbi:MAG: hypothetical protein UX88_C0001G0031 [Candidatus Woesebacteria bacterium GW2011_GWC2_47_16]|uniref:O-antigen ligase-related domain-containing protein n=8 Tax=Candidatus Woeseibacteriota TaxID=1752722 RepID=A0A0G1QWN4_9BACT|nr:MAG: hypothetical protein UX03_C0003G0020 [Candidatus Woesebacteria bacterium GW2011_GWE1_45_18]KKU25156.1 MAG: hypothetical protein UX34_C0002G0019 [Candidatus Woesebacteria bacterium GW2011_GWF1_46_13]KKU49322.1 MAG: hypothetical protein UX67_C0002G0007 [Candidatus Woesebacteria bacterium GW2011_GWF2_46_8]KKU65371.1 MAG: hypothetical protein UX88_C0001G0031 [Candidatus Woesebacteria bacterium GW2011_GWC2_47_16]KKU71202.1 MAG: hypothetical protein UX95_C0002G0023 [Candidatus Woesebacteria b